jgi:hypothetical protein
MVRLMMCGLVLALACSGGEGGVTAKTPACQALADCGLSVTDCDKVFGALVLTKDCENAMLAASCAEHKKTTPAYMGTCFPPCTGSDAQCAADQKSVSKCQDAKTMNLDCTGVCATQGLKFSGKCATTIGGQTSSTGDDVCWCSNG